MRDSYMKNAIWLMSALSLTTLCSVAHAQSGRISISSATKSVNIVAPQLPQAALSDKELNQAIDGLIASSQSQGRISHTYASADSSFLQHTSQASQTQTHIITSPSSASAANAALSASRAAHSKSVGRCALYVRKALQSAGYSFTPKASAYQYAHGTLAGAGFTQISSTNYVPQIGDVVVFNRTSKNPHGHIQIYDGSQWVSDFRQPKFSPYSQHNGYTVWRDVRGATINNGAYLAMNDSK